MRDERSPARIGDLFGGNVELRRAPNERALFEGRRRARRGGQFRKPRFGPLFEVCMGSSRSWAERGPPIGATSCHARRGATARVIWVNMADIIGLGGDRGLATVGVTLRSLVVTVAPLCNALPPGDTARGSHGDPTESRERGRGEEGNRDPRCAGSGRETRSEARASATRTDAPVTRSPGDEQGPGEPSPPTVSTSGQLHRPLRHPRSARRHGRRVRGVRSRARPPVALKLLHPGPRLVEGRRARDACFARPRRSRGCRTRTSSPSYDVGTIAATCSSRWSSSTATRSPTGSREAAHSGREILAVFLAAGRGLAAAHAAGSSIATSSPATCSSARRPRPRARLRARPATDSSDDPVSELASHEAIDTPGALELATSQDRLLAQLTRAGSILGTPSFMAPEQHLGDVVDERADQYGFCVSLYGALYGVPPFEGNTILELRGNVLAGRVAEPPRARACRAGRGGSCCAGSR